MRALDTGLLWVLPSWNYLMDSVSWEQLDTGFTHVVSSLELFDR
jgi:hypothetical protein